MMRARLLCLIMAAVVVPCSGSVRAQTRAYPSNVGVDAGLSFGGPLTGTVGLEVRKRVRGSLAVTAGAGRWFLEGGCDLIVGVPCYRGGWTATFGAAVGLGRQASASYPYLTARLGPLRYNTHQTAWIGTAGIGLLRAVGSRLGLQAEVRYHAQLHQASGLRYSPPAGGRSVLSVGVVFGVKR